MPSQFGHLASKVASILARNVTQRMSRQAAETNRLAAWALQSEGHRVRAASGDETAFWQL